MNDSDLKQIRGVVKEEINVALVPIKKTLGKHTVMLDKQAVMLDKQAKKIDALWDQTVELTEDMAEVKVPLKSHSVDLDHTKKRVTSIEDHLGL